MKNQPRAEERRKEFVIPLSSRSRRLAPGRPSPISPAWPTLIVILLVGVGLFALTDTLTHEGAWRAITDSLTISLMFGAMAGWVRANRPALAQIDERACEGPPLEIRHVISERHPVWGAEAKRPRRERVRLRGARQAWPGPERG
jgi:hypothetical protein